jgi:hypothetical protein
MKASRWKAADPAAAAVHHRTPVIVAERHFDLWLSRTVQEFACVLRPFAAGAMPVLAMSRRVRLQRLGDVEGATAGHLHLLPIRASCKQLDLHHSLPHHDGMPTKRKRRRPFAARPPLSLTQILAWADAFHDRWGRWPNRYSGPIDGTADERWSAVDGALHHGHRGLPKGGSLIMLLAERRGYRHRNYLPALRVHDILRWVDAHKRRTGEWPTGDSGPVADAPGETWNAIDLALERGTRGLRGGSSLADLLARRRGRRRRQQPPDLAEQQILAWAEAHRTLFGVYPTRNAGPVGSTGETWNAIEHALQRGSRGLAGGSSLFRLLKQNGKVRGNYTPYRRRKGGSS